MANYEGLALPAFGAGYHYADGGTTANWSISDGGGLDMAVTTATADNVLQVTHTASAALTSGYDQSVYVALNISSTTSGNNATQRHAFATDILITGTHASWIGGGYVYIYGSSATVSSGAIYGLNLHIAECGAADYLVNLWLQRDSTSTSGLDAYILFSGHPAGQSTAALFYVQGTKPTYFLQAAASGGFIDTTTSFGTAPAATGALKVLIGSTAHYIKLQAS